jgi:exodeoxyribonuclease III
MRFRGGPAFRWDAAERNVLCGLSPFGMNDVYRTLHGYEAEAVSWVLVRGGQEVGRRFDHVFASEHFRPLGCTYLEDWRRVGLSDHAAIEAELEQRSNLCFAADGGS